MTYKEIENFMEKKQPWQSAIKISFKTRKPINGMFIRTSDYKELSKKNLWRIVTELHFDNYKNSNDINLARIFNGVEITRLEVLSPS